MEDMKTGNADIDAKVEEWMRWDQNDTNRAEIRQLALEKNVDELKKRLLQRMEFGTAGLRARMGAGYSMMNDLTIIQATQGLVKYLIASVPDAKKNGLVVGYDARHNSQKWSELVATICINEGMLVYKFSEICPTPYVPYAVVHYGASCGVMITASHNPKEDNGYKVYWTNGAQIIPPIDKGIATSIREHLEPFPTSWNTSCVADSKLLRDPYDKIFDLYNKDLHHLCHFRDQNLSSKVIFTYTAMHGVGYKFVREALQSFGFLPPVLLPVEKQVWPDPEFPTVKYPNPEEKGALTLSKQMADDKGSVVILANDPDADRLAVAEKQPRGKWRIFSGNEIGALLGWWSLFTFRKSHPDVKNKDICMVASTVSSKILQTIAKQEGCIFDETLTGFKWIANKACDRQNDGKHVIFAFEEAIGFMCGTKVLDKDGVSAAAVMAEMATFLYNHDSTLAKQLEEIFNKYGYHLSQNSYFRCDDPAITAKMFQNLRNFDGPGKYPSSCGPYKIKYVRDLTGKGYDNSQPDNVPILPTSKSSEMITFTFENGCVATLRTSGTEPKIKYYTEHKPDPTKGMDREAAKRELNDMVHCIETHFFQPKTFGLIPQSKL
ncbi:phosphoglucomutase-2-like isoform X2 [Haliotis rufescens]|uniref:phosphoglucomutase-2-like isoform X2 n=1 Tax=Haliotis rufescens TaxID=6454 RepID=UPI00201F3306|nr:phosphoglucomutase-2-like isoform X2 [Haliotis rufescens]